MISRLLTVLCLLPVVTTATAQELQLHSFSRQQLSDVYYSEGIAAGDVNSDRVMDIVYGPHWYAGPEYTAKQEIYPAVPQNREGYADKFFSWIHDFDKDGWNDILVVGFPGTPASVYQNPGKDGLTGLWEKHQVADSVSNEAPQFADMNGDGLLDIVTGKTYWSHHSQSPMLDAGAVVYWFELSRSHDGVVDFIPHLADGEAGIGRGLVVEDLNKDGLIDIVCGGMKGANVLMHAAQAATEDEFRQAQPQKRKDMAEGLSPGDAANHMTVPPGFRVQLAAGEPMVHQPVAMCFDHKGRLWVAEAHTYPLRAPDGEGKDKILIFEDTTGDGVFDTSKTFIEGLNLVSGMEIGFGGVYVGAAPYLMFIPDHDGDDVPDSMPGGISPGTAQPEVQFPNDVPPGAIVLRDGFGC